MGVALKTKKPKQPEDSRTNGERLCEAARFGSGAHDVQRGVASGGQRESVTFSAKEESMRSEHSASGVIALGCAVAAAMAFSSASTIAGEAKGTITYKSKAGAIVVTIKNAYLIKGPDVVSGKTIRRVVLSVADIGAKLGACGTMLCSDGDIGEGMTIDFDAGPRLNYWFVGNNQLVQYSGTADPASARSRCSAAGRARAAGVDRRIRARRDAPDRPRRPAGSSRTRRR